MDDSNPPKPKLRWYQFSLRTLLIAVLLAAIGSGFLGQRIQRIRNEIKTTAELEKLGARIEFLPLPTDDPKRRKPDIGLARERLGWEPRIKLEKGLKKTIAYFRELLDLR